MQPAGYGGLDHERTPLQRPRFSRQAVLAAPLFAAVAGLVILVVLELAPESALHRASLASALQAPITADHHHRNITSAAPHIVLAVLDDAGWDDWLRRPIWPPARRGAAESGLSLRSHYAAHECTPSRGSLLSGRYPTAGYRTALVGKWHLGHYNESLTPARRGFGESYGFLGGFVDHFTRVAEAPPACASDTPATDGTCALDWQVNGLPRPRATGVYAAYACRDAARRLVADNGASAAGGSNAPLRGAKGGYFEGGVRTRALLAGSLLPQNVRGSSHEGLVHVADWAPTLLNAAGLRPDLVAGFDAMDGVDQWDALRGLARRRATRSSWASTTRRRAAAPRARSGGEVEAARQRRPGASEDVYDAEPDIAAALEKRLVELHVAAEAPRYCAPTRAELDGARAAFAARGNVVQPWAPLVRTGDRSHCDDARRDADAIRADSCARGLLAPAACDGARSARS
ncbi:sulfuric ester hydrolase [Aureococcus anophagefferens]|nr:sulfuric ester hydrolase [Aureococcus anophagefferens]